MFPPSISMTPLMIKAIRFALALSPVEFALACGLKSPRGSRVVRRWESGETSPSGPSMKHLKRLYDRASPSLIASLRDDLERMRESSLSVPEKPAPKLH